MELRVPRGASLLDQLGRDGADPTALTGGDAALDSVTPAELDTAIAALERGDVEYLGLHQHGTFVQVAGEGSGPYQLEASLGDVDQQVAVPGGVTLDGVRLALHGFLAGDLAWPQSFPWEHGAQAPPPVARRSWFRRR